MDHIWGLWLVLHNKVSLYNVCIVPIALYASETWTMTQTDNNRLDAFDQWCLRRLSNVRWTDHETNVKIRRRTSQGPLSSAVTRRRLCLFGRVARLDRLRDTSRVLRAKIPRDWKRPKGRPRSTWVSTVEKDLSPVNFGIFTALK